VPELRFTMLRQGERRDGATVLLRIQHLSVRVGIRRVIDDVDLDVFEGDTICISGPNGSGKSTLLNAIAGLEPARIEAGTISLGGEDVTSLPPHERSRRGIAFMRQRENVFLDLTVDENLRLAVGAAGPAWFRDAFPSWTADLPGRKRVGLLSGGQKQQLAWGMATLRPSRLLLADEPEAGMSSRPPVPTNATLLLVSHEPWKENPV
jgi:ABC-type branched-subunit amino acid transport system ATPase component